jgi:Protein of unknown function (DUF3109)
MSACGNKGLQLKVCDIAQCEGACCYDGVYLLPSEETFLRELVALVPELRAKLPEEFIVDGYWEGERQGRKTATRPHDYKSPDYPAHFARTRCVFADEVGLCELEKLARGRGQHPWTFKPTTCWMFPLQDDAGEPAEPVRDAKDDPYYSKEYPGYASCVSCGRHDANGQPWREALQKEVAYLESAVQLPILGSAGNSAAELLAAGIPGKKNPT